MAFQFPDPAVTPEFTGANGITYSWDAVDSKWVVKGFPVPEADDCPSYTAVAVNYVSGSDPTEQIGISWFAFGNQNGKPFSEVRIHGWGLEVDQSAQFIYINDTPYSIYRGSIIGGDPVYEIDAAHGDLNSLYVGTEVTVRLCEPCEEVCKDYVDERFDELHDEINNLKGATIDKFALTYSFSELTPGTFQTNSSNVGSLSSIKFHPDDSIPTLKAGDEVMITGVSLGGRLICDVTQLGSVANTYHINPRSNSNTLAHGDVYIVTVVVFP